MQFHIPTGAEVIPVCNLASNSILHHILAVGRSVAFLHVAQVLHGSGEVIPMVKSNCCAFLTSLRVYQSLWFLYRDALADQWVGPALEWRRDVWRPEATLLYASRWHRCRQAFAWKEALRCLLRGQSQFPSLFWEIGLIPVKTRYPSLPLRTALRAARANSRALEKSTPGISIFFSPASISAPINLD